MIKNLRHTAIVVHDLNKCRDFYQNFLNLKLIKEDVEEGPFIESVVGLGKTKLHWIKLQAPSGIIIELLKYLSPEESQTKDFSLLKQPSYKTGHSHLAFTVENIESFTEELIKRNGSIVNPPAVNPEGTVKVCYAHDPEGNLLEIVEEL